MKHSVLFLVILLLGLPLPARGAEQPNAVRPNVLFIAVDDLRPQLGCYGDQVVQSPNIDRLAGRGLRFDRAYCQYPVFNPSRTSLLTRLRPDTTGVLDNTTFFRKRLPDVVTLPQLFRRQGYTAVRLGKIFHGARDFEDPKAWDQAEYPAGTERGKKGEGRNLTEGRLPWCRWLAAEGDDEDQPDGQIAREAVRFLEQKRDQPFFLALGFHKPHDPFVARSATSTSTRRRSSPRRKARPGAPPRSPTPSRRP
jgi:iduronate 2-sulfatase